MTALTLLIGELLCFGLAYLSLVFQIVFIAYQNDSHFFVSVVPDLLKPLSDRLKCFPPCDIINKKYSYCLPVVCVRDCSISLLSCGVPDLSSYEHVLNRNVMGGKFNSNCSVGIALKLVLRISQKKLWLSDLRVSDQNKLEHVVIRCTFLLTEEVILLHFTCHVYFLVRFYNFCSK